MARQPKDGGITWTNETWNPIRGCSRISEGCRHCYAEQIAGRFSGPGQPFEMFADRAHGEARWTGRVELIEKHLNDPLHWKEPRMVFISMSDLFHEKLTFSQIESVFRVMLSAPQHTYQILTKRAERLPEAVTTVMNRIFGPHWKMPDFIWLGVSVEDQKTADERIPLLLQTPAAVRFVSYEPALAGVDFTRIMMPDGDSLGSGLFNYGADAGIDWVIVGGESGPSARPFNIQWARNTVEQCKAAGVPVFVKQLGREVHDRNDAGFEGDDAHAWPMDTWYAELDSGYQGAPVRILLDDPKGGTPSEWPEDLRVREFPNCRAGVAV